MNETKLPELPYERIAMSGGQMPEKLGFADQQLFLQLRLLYDSYRKGIIDRESAQKEKKSFLTEYNVNLIMENFTRQWVEQNKKTEQARQAYRKNRTLENADALILAFEGAPVTFNEEAL
jgi:uncharacterized protein YbcC (UPF0753/DUF2309 family)